MNKKDKKVINIIAATTLCVGTISFFTSKYMVNYAINRKQPKPLTKSRKSTHKPTLKRKFYSEMSIKQNELNNIPHEIITLKSHNGTILKGHYFRKENAKRTILAMHGWRSAWNRDFAFIGEFLINSDSNVLFVEQRGQNSSEGKYIGLGLIERFDCVDWIRWINTHTPTTLPIYLYGISMGATSVLMATGQNLPKNVVGVIADCGFTSPDNIGDYVVRHKMHMFYGLKKLWSKTIFKHRTHLKMNEYSTLQAMKECKIPILFIHGQDDNFVPVEMTYDNYNTCKCEKELLIIPKASHAMSCFVEPEKYKTFLTNFWAKHDI